ncbi:hypothetical protein ACAG39_08790 [Caldicellulosiruptoraceae bacterium PP1]
MSRMERLLKRKKQMRIIIAIILLLLFLCFVAFIIIEQYKISRLPKDNFLLKIIETNDKYLIKLLNGKFILSINKSIYNFVYSKISYIYFKIKGIYIKYAYE